LQDRVESEALYDLLEREIIPLFYHRGMDGLPREWIRRMKDSMREVGRRFSTHRMLLEYTESFYAPALANARSLMDKGCNACKDTAAYLARLRHAWDSIRIEQVESPSDRILSVGDTISVKARISLAGLAPEDLGVELYYGPLSSQGDIEQPRRQEMAPCGESGGASLYCAQVRCDQTGRQGYTVRILPRHESLVHPFLPGLIKWA
ncbi:MAG TPA: alpha-glucan phosphorylase, partial [Spirochaetia bacterium]|nr:alpha-glucan phosphorylase [Spirochaetia bacterium]